MTQPRFSDINNKDYIVEALKLTRNNAKDLLGWYYKATKGFDGKISESVWGEVIKKGTGFSVIQYDGKMSYISIGDYLVKDFNGFYTYQGRDFEERHIPLTTN